MHSNHKVDVLIIGGGWAGLSAAIKLTEQGKSVYILEVAKQLGGRARKIQYKQYSVDNGTHIMIGAYTETLKLIKRVHTKTGCLTSSVFKESNIFERQGLNLNYKRINAEDISIPSIPLPAPFNIILSFLFSQGLTLTEKRLILGLGLKIKLNLITQPSDINLELFLTQQKQTARIIKNIWEPLCLAILNTSIAEASAEIFLHVIKEAFFQSRSASDLLFFKKDLSEVFPVPAKKYIEQLGGKVFLNQIITSLKKESSYYTVTTGLNLYHAKDIIIASAPIAATRLLKQLNSNQCFDKLITALAPFSYQPVCTVYLQYPEPIHCERTMQGFLGTTIQWMFDKHLTNNAGFISIIISSQGDHMNLDNTGLIDLITDELSQLYPDWPQTTDAFVIREKRATFTASVNINRIRPSNKTDMSHIWLAGDYTDTLYPATLEGAVRSGLSCAKKLLAE